MGRVDGKVAFVTGAARGQGRSHALRLAQEGADIIAVDIAHQIDSVPFPMATPDDLAETVRQVEALGRKIIATQTDVRDAQGLKRALDEGVAQLGRLDIVVANAGIVSYGLAQDLEAQTWNDVLDVNLTGVWHTAKAAIPHLIDQRSGGSIVLISSTRGLTARPNLAHYVAAKHGVVGLMRSLAVELAPHMIRVNTVHPGGVDTDMIHNATTYGLFAPDLPAHERTKERLRERFQALNAQPVPWVDPVEISHAVLFLSSDEARYITGVVLPVDAGSTLT
ncbi:MAG: mycofactocin-coupled SDR family oxidoreductase [Actinomycetota bacterium]